MQNGAAKVEQRKRVLHGRGKGFGGGGEGRVQRKSGKYHVKAETRSAWGGWWRDLGREGGNRKGEDAAADRFE